MYVRFVTLVTFYLNNLLFLLEQTHKKKRDNKQTVKKRIDTHLLYTCEYFQIIYLNFKIQMHVIIGETS
jgi:hypothetical protein